MTGSTRRHEKRLHFQYAGLLILGLLGLGAALSATRPLLIVNPSPSLPTGLYMRALTARPLALGDMVVLETPDVLKPSLPPGYEDKPLLKQVAALPGMQACWMPEAMVVERGGEPVWYAYHPALTTLRQPEGCRQLGPDDLLVTGSHARSYDSRYVGMISQRLVRFRVWPLWTKRD